MLTSLNDFRRDGYIKASPQAGPPRFLTPVDTCIADEAGRDR